MTKLKFVHTHSAIDKFHTCPRQYEASYIKNEVKFSDSYATALGSIVHLYLEYAAKGFTVDLNEIADHCSVGLSRLNAIVNMPTDSIHAELELAVTHDLKPTHYRDKEALFRGKNDLVVILKGGKTAFLLDWKTGSARDSEQLRRNAVCVFAKFPSVDTIKTAYIFTSGEPAIKSEYKRSDIDGIVSEIKANLENIEYCIGTGIFPTKASGLCKRWCDVMSCENNGLKEVISSIKSMSGLSDISDEYGVRIIEKNGKTARRTLSVVERELGDEFKYTIIDGECRIDVKTGEEL